MPRLEWWLAAGIAVVVSALLVVWAGRTTAEASSQTARFGPPSSPDSVVQLRFTSTPSGALVRDPRSGALLGTTPFSARLPREDRTMTVEVVKDGYQPATQDIDLGSDGGLMVALIATPPN